jgi:HD-GYP domain-containing protein (c-di-GMP phosphodiesterase class II)
MPDALGGTRILVVGADGPPATALRAALVDAGAAGVEVVPSAAHALERVLKERPDAIVAVDTLAHGLQETLDPLGTAAGPPVVALAVGEDPHAAVVERVQLLVERQALRRRLAELEPVVAAQAVARSREREQVLLEGLNRLAVAAAYRDDNTREHTQRVGHLAARLGRRMGLTDRSVWILRHGAPLHDIGKIAIPDTILLKPGRLTGEEFEVVKTHALVGARILARGDADVVTAAEQIVRSHHERWDGGGYPDALAGAAIPVLARIVKVADVFDILVHERPHKEAWTDEQAADEIRAGAGSQFDPDVVEAFEDLGPHAWRTPPELLDMA